MKKNSFNFSPLGSLSYPSIYQLDKEDIREFTQDLESLEAVHISSYLDSNKLAAYQDHINKRVNSLKLERSPEVLEDILQEEKLLGEGRKVGVCKECKKLTKDLIKFKKKEVCGECLNSPQGDL